MTSSQLKAKVVRIRIERGSEGLFYADSPDLKGLLVAQPTIEALRSEIPTAIAEMFEACDTPVTVTEVEDDDAWVAVPIVAVAHRHSQSV